MENKNNRDETQGVESASKTNLNFGQALRILKGGGHVARSGWACYLYVKLGSLDKIKAIKGQPAGREDMVLYFGVDVRLFCSAGAAAKTIMPKICQMTANGVIHDYHLLDTDILAEDWFEVDSKGNDSYHG